MGPWVVQIGDEQVEVGEQTVHRARVGPLPGRGELLRPAGRLRHRRRAGLDMIWDIEDLPEVGLDRVLVDIGHLGDHIPAAVDQTPLTARVREDLVERGAQPGRTVGDHQHRHRPQPSGDDRLEKRHAGVGGLGRHAVEMHQQ